MTNEEFYRECADRLGTVHDSNPFPYRYRTRWNNRVPGSGRFEGYGIIRVFGDQVQVSLRHPIQITKIFDSKEAVLKFLESIPS